MSDGYFNYNHVHMNDIAEALADVIREWDSKTELPEILLMDYNPDTIEEYRRHQSRLKWGYLNPLTVDVLRVGLYNIKWASTYVREIDSLLSGNVTPEVFLRQLHKELKSLEYREGI